MDRTTIEDAVFPDCPIRNILARLCDKWSLLVLYTLNKAGSEPVRFKELQREIPDISQKMLTVTLRTLEEDGYVTRTIYPEVPPRVEYALTERTHSLLPHINSLIAWALENRKTGRHLPDVTKPTDISTSKIMWKAYALLSALFAAMTAIFAKVGVKDINSNLATAIRTTVILFITWGIVLFGSHLSEIKDIPRHSWLFLVLSGAATGLSWLFYFKALQTGDVSRVAPIDKLSVVITICLSFLFLKEPVSPKVILGALLITCGSILMLIK